MTTRIHNNQPPTPPQPASPVRARAPAGVGAAPTTMQGAGDPPEANGWIRKAVLAIRDLVVWIYSKIFSYFGENEPAPAPVVDERQERINQLQNMNGVQIMDEFYACYKEDYQRRLVYIQIGREQRGLKQWFQSDEKVGEAMVFQNPKPLLMPYLTPPDNQ